MKNKGGKYKEPKMSEKTGKPIMEARLIFLEPALWDLFDRLAKTTGKTRSTFIRCDLKDRRCMNKMSGIDWSESNTI